MDVDVRQPCQNVRLRTLRIVPGADLVRSEGEWEQNATVGARSGESMNVSCDFLGDIVADVEHERVDIGVDDHYSVTQGGRSVLRDFQKSESLDRGWEGGCLDVVEATWKCGAIACWLGAHRDIETLAGVAGAVHGLRVDRGP